MPDLFVAKSIKGTKEKTPSASVTPKRDVEKLKGHNHNPFSSFCYYPHNVGFVNQEPNEEVILLVRRHLITNIPWIIFVIVMIFAPFVLAYFPFLSFLPIRFQLVSLLFWYLLTMAILIQNFLNWFFSINIITNKRVVDVDFENIIYRKITDAELGNIEDVTVQMGSVVRTLFDYGDLLIQTAAEVPEVEFLAVPHPDKIDKILSDLRMKTK